MVTGFERSTRVRIPKNDAKTYHDFVTRDPAFEASDKSLAVVVHRKGQPEDAMDVDENAHAILAAWEGFPAVSYADDERVSVAMHGHISNAPEIRELYGLPPAEPVTSPDPSTPDNSHGLRRSRRISGNKVTMNAAADVNANGQSAAANVPRIEGARLVLELYQRRFEDKDGDPSDQPVTALTACEGSFSFVLVDKDRDAILIARSSESDTHPLFWGVYIVTFVFWVGIAHAGTLISAILYLFRAKWRNEINRSAEAMTVINCHQCSFCFVADKSTQFEGRVDLYLSLFSPLSVFRLSLQHP